MGSFGERLRREREMRGISLDEIVATTKIGRRLLTALEDEQFDLLPGGIFNKAYVRAYAKCVGINEDEAVAEYLQAANEVPPDTRVIAQQHASIHSNRPAQSSGFPVMPVFILLVVIAAGFGGWKIYQDHQRDKSAATSGNISQPIANAAPASSGNGSAGTEAPSPQHPTPAIVSHGATQAASLAGSKTTPSGSTGQTAQTPNVISTASATGGTSFEVTVRPKDSAWVSIKSDGKYVVRGIIRPPDVKTIQATDQIVFYTGNAGAVEVSFNGKNVPLSGGPNAEQVLVFGSHGVMPAAQARTSTQ